ncbi:Rieske (2Fe-2S) protein [Actinoplanes sp. KI2]|uniref:Rieske (2Fe-2S) protein n=1 Tax=Actinoplanes sp. KI2 TaxID=2983315 RepID=UPI0021D5D820|nr:Rieske (2Fe-2S) protein [Actinoplanes sp. KI2]MCU7729583.1 Rieske (2Fe-2S) protein [Actinoplanes sp. KI2]
MLVPIPDGQGRRRWSVRGAGRILAVFEHPESGRLIVTEARCPHAGAPIQDGWIQHDSVVCPWHRYRFDPADGQCRNSTRYRLPVYPTVVHEGRWYAEVPFNPLGDRGYPRGRHNPPE